MPYIVIPRPPTDGGLSFFNLELDPAVNHVVRPGCDADISHTSSKADQLAP